MRGTGHVAHRLHRGRPVGHCVRALSPPRVVRPAQAGSPLAQVPRPRPHGPAPRRPPPPRGPPPPLRPAFPPRVPARRFGPHPPLSVERPTQRPGRPPRLARRPLPPAPAAVGPGGPARDRTADRA